MREFTSGRIAGAIVAILWMASVGEAAFIISWSNQAVSGFDGDEQQVVQTAIEVWNLLITDRATTGGLGVETFPLTVTRQVAGDVDGDGDADGFDLFAKGVATSIFQTDVHDLPASGTIDIWDQARLGGDSLLYFVDDDPSGDLSHLPSDLGVATHGIPKPGGAADPLNGLLSDNASHSETMRIWFDLLTVVLHEIGHTLGFTETNPLWDAATNNLTGVLSYGSQTALLGARSENALSHLVESAHPRDLMVGALDRDVQGDRRMPTELDLDILTGIYGYSVDTSQLRSVPEPAAGALMALGGLVMLRRRRAR